MIGNFFGNLKKPYFHVKTAVATFWTTFGNIWAAFYSNIWLHCFSNEFFFTFFDIFFVVIFQTFFVCAQIVIGFVNLSVRRQMGSML